MKRLIQAFRRHIICRILHRSHWSRWVKFVYGEKARVLRCDKCHEEWEPHPISNNTRPSGGKVYTAG